MKKITTYLVIFSMLFIVTSSSNSAVRKNSYMTMINKENINTYEIYDEGDKLTLEEKDSNKINEAKDINLQIVEQILKFEGSDLVDNSTEYSKFGLTKQFINKYNKKYKTHYIVKKLSKNDAIKIMLNIMKDTRVSEIKNPEIRVLVFDTLYNSGNYRAGLITQATINYYYRVYSKGRKNVITEDGIIGSNTIKYLNKIDKPEIFKQLFIYERLNSYKKLNNWNKYGNGWTKRIIEVSNLDIKKG